MGLREDKVGTLEDAAAKRKARLQELKNRKRNIQDETEKKSGANEEDLPTPQVLFRNYRPESEVLAEGVLEPAKPADVEQMVTEQVTEATESVSALQQVELSSLAPKKVTFDLKRAIESRLEKLERATDRAIAELIRERLRDEAVRGQQDLVAAVNAGATVHAAHDDDD
ncbi:mRNA splicing factor Cwf18 [Trinorchestia longiramus]|nr:mRNA splicing factor Cwf18 [Trinorchestia longiramus]